jgi:HPt (histidine-containing phosphotransfer) domain-containing protein
MSDLGFAAQLAEDLSVDDLRMVLSVFRTDVQRLTGTLADAARGGDDAGFRRAAHGLAGAAGAVGAAGLERACRRAMAAAPMVGAPMSGVMDEIDALADMALSDLAGFLARLDSPR